MGAAGDYFLSFLVLGFPILCLIWFPLQGIFALIQKVMPNHFKQVSLEKSTGWSLAIAFLISNILVFTILEPNDSNTTNSSNADSQIDFSKYATIEPMPTLSTIPIFNYDYDFELPTVESYSPENFNQHNSGTSAIVFVTYPTSAYPGTRPTVKIKGKPYTTYDITVHYSSGPSRAAGLEPKQSNSEGYVMWSWKVGTNTYAGSYPIIVSGGGEEATIYFEVLS